MKKLFTLLALLTCFLGANAVEFVDAEVDFSKYSDISEVPFASWRGSESAFARLSLKDGCLHFESTEATDPSWDCQFFPIGGVNAEIDVTYTLHFKIKGDHAGNVSMLGFGQTPYGQFAITTDWVEGTVDYVATNTDGNILMQCGDWVGTWDIAYLKITHEGKEQRPVEWIEMITNGDAETPWTDAQKATLFTETDNTINICAWSKEKGVNMNENDGWDPFVAGIEVDPTDPSNHVFVCHGQPATTEGDASAWDNQFWIMSPKQLKVGAEYKFHFRYRATATATTNTQMHSAQPSDYLHWQVLGDVTFTTEWQEYDNVVTIPAPQNDKPIHSIAFNLNAQNKDAIDFYFDDLSIQEMKLDEGWYVAGSNQATGIAYDYDNAIEFTQDPDDPEVVVATVGTVGKKDSWVNEIQISTVRGNDKAFKSSTIKPVGTIKGNDPDNWQEYAAGSGYKISLPAAGVWAVYIAPNLESTKTEGQILFMQVEGDPIELPDPVAIVTNTTEFVVNATERDWKPAKDDGTPQDGEEGIGEGQPWDNQFWIAANRDLKTDEVTVVKFQYKAAKAATASTQVHKVGDDGKPCTYLNWQAIGSVDFTEEWLPFEKEFKIPAGDEGMRSIVFNLSEFKPANDYYIKDVQWYLYDSSLEEGMTYENLIKAEDTSNFWIKVDKSAPYQYGTDPSGITNVTAKKNSSAVIYNIAGQKVDKNFKGLVVKDGKKFMNK